MEWMTVNEAGEQWGITTRRVAALCANGKVTGAQRLGSFWVIPKGTPKPIDGRTKEAKVRYGAERLATAPLGNGNISANRGDSVMLSIEEIRSYVVPVIGKYPVDKVILIGSHARGDATNVSDVDLIVDSQGRLLNRKIFALGGELLAVFPVRVDVYDILEIANPSAMYDNIMREGVVIYDSTR